MGSSFLSQDGKAAGRVTLRFSSMKCKCVFLAVFSGHKNRLLASRDSGRARTSQ